MTKLEPFWRLHSLPSARRFAELEESVDFETVHCPKYPGHQRAGRRHGPLRVILPSGVDHDFMWSWFSDCMVQKPVLDLLHRHSITGYTTKAVEARRKSPLAAVPELFELIATGWGGMAKPSSGIRLDSAKSCGSCGLLVYSGMTEATELFDPDQWDGSDIFIIWPMPRFMFVSNRLARLLRAAEFTGLSLHPLDELPPTSSTLSPGRLSHWMPDDRARELGEPLGIV